MKLEDDTVWPLDIDGGVAWKLRYSPEALTRADMLLAASILNVWSQVTSPDEPIDPTIKQIRSIRRRMKAARAR